MARLEFIGSFYYSSNPGYILPAEVIEATINGGARKFREGMDAKSGMVIMNHAKLEFADSELPPQELWAKEEYRFQKMVTVSRARILRTRPIIENWQAEIEVTFEDSVCSKAQVKKWLDKAGEIVGLCDWRPRYGRFKVEAL